MIEELYDLENKIKEEYMMLATLEYEKKANSYDFNSVFQLIIEDTKKEGVFLAKHAHQLKELKRNVLKDRLEDDRKSNSFLPNPFYERINSLFENIAGDDTLDYVQTLNYDINQIMLLFLEALINNPYYENIQKDLIEYKYNLIYMNFFSEDDFLNGKEGLKLESFNYQTDDFPIFSYINKAVLVLPASNFLTEIYGLDEEFRENSKVYALTAIQMINMLARLSLCDQASLQIIEPELDIFMTEESICTSLRELYLELLEILNGLKNIITRNR